MGRASKYINHQQGCYIRMQHKLLTPAELAKQLKIPYSNVYNFLVRNGLSILFERAKKEKCVKKTAKSKFFDVGGMNNWLIY